jgi:pyrimidine operon attenuation protein/uracil phosphoribosyltransferase
VRGLKLSDLVGVHQRGTHFIHAIDEVLTHDLIDIKTEKLAIFHFHPTRDQIDFQGQARVRCNKRMQLVDIRFTQYDGK